MKPNLTEVDAGHPRVLLDAGTIARRVAELGRQITGDYAGRRLCLVGVLKGSIIFFADLARAIDLPLSCSFIGISSYGDQRHSSGRVRVTQPLEDDIEGKDVLLVEDIVDSGLSMRTLFDYLSARKAASVTACTLLKKPSNLRVEVVVKYVGFSIADHFVVGYGLDDRGLCRNLPFIGVRDPGDGQQQPS